MEKMVAPQRGNWLREAQLGSPAALERLLDSFRAYLLAVAGAEIDEGLRAKVAPSDIVQETLLEAHQGFGRFQGDSADAMMAWLRRILLNNLANQRRHFYDTDKRDVRREVPLDHASSDLPVLFGGPGRALASAEQERMLERALAELPDDYRVAIIGRNRDNLTFVQIGERLGRSEEAARKIWMRAILALKEKLDPSHDAA